MSEAVDVVDILVEQRAGEAHALAQFGDRLPRRRGAAAGEEELGRIAGHEVEQEEDDADDDVEQRRRDKAALRDVADQAMPVASSMKPEKKVSAPGRLRKPWT